MGDPAGQGPDGLHLLRLPQLRLQMFLLDPRLLLRGNIDCRADEPVRLAGSVAQAVAACRQPTPRSARLARTVFALVTRRTSLEMVCKCRIPERRVIGVNDGRRHPCAT